MREGRAWLVTGAVCLALAVVLGSVTVIRALDDPAGGPPAPAPAPAGSADALPAQVFHHSIGLNIHNNHGDTAYGEWDRIVAALRRLGVRHVRDGLKARTDGPGRVVQDAQVDRLTTLARLGIRVQVILGAPGQLDAEGDVDDLLGLVRRRLVGVVDGLEGPNEFDLTGGEGFAPKLRRWQADLHRAANADPALRDLPVIAPSFVDAGNAERVGDLSAHADLGNMHPYPGGAAPGGEHLAGELAKARAVSGTRPVQATEVGYHNLVEDRTGQPGVSERASAAYLPRVLLEHRMRGVPRTYLFQLIDEGPDPGRTTQEQHFGLLRNDFTPKPAYLSLGRLLAVTADGSDEPAGPAVPSPRVEERVARLRRLDLVTRQRTRLVVLWRDAPAFDLESRSEVRERPARVTVATPLAATRRRVVPLDPALPIGDEEPAGSRTTLEVGAFPVVLGLGTEERLPALPEWVLEAHRSRSGAAQGTP